MKLLLTFIFSTICALLSQAQSVDNLKFKGNYSVQDSINITNAYIHAKIAVDKMHNAMDAIWIVDTTSKKSPKSIRKEQWRADKNFMSWLREPIKIGKAHKKINRIYTKFQKEITLEIIKEDEGRCGRFVSAWTVPYGKVKIRLCRNFVNFGPNSQAKTIIHELGHEAGLLFDRGVYHCRSAKSVALNPKKYRATKRPENYAWLAMSYIGVGCNTIEHQKH